MADETLNCENNKENMASLKGDINNCTELTNGGKSGSEYQKYADFKKMNSLTVDQRKPNDFEEIFPSVSDKSDLKLYYSNLKK